MGHEKIKLFTMLTALTLLMLCVKKTGIINIRYIIVFMPVWGYWVWYIINIFWKGDQE